MALLEGMNAVVTGSTKGIGRGIALELAREGARVLINHRGEQSDTRSAENERETLRLIREAGGISPLVCVADMSREEGARHLASIALKEFGRVDVWVNNVGLHHVTPALEQSMEAWERLFRLNTTSAFLGCREACKIMRPMGGGSIINISSKMGTAGSAQNACYCSAKAAVIMMTRCLAAEWASSGIRVNAIAPGVTLTEPTFAVVAGKPALEAALHYRTPVGRFAEPAEIGKVAVFLASAMSSYVTGAIIACDGGWTAHADYAGIPPEKIEDWEQEFPRLLRK
jgi:NAD(P)-dependent dehydrogenase (short-subunit alcohol dehydrogenase family)